MKSIWDSLAKMSQEDREKFLPGRKSLKNVVKTEKLGTESVLYTTTTIEGPSPGGPLVWQAGWDEGE